MSESEQILQECTSDARYLRLPISTRYNLDVSVSGNWATLECNVREPVGPDTVSRLDAVVRGWVIWVNTREAENDPSQSDGVVHVSEPVSGVDFIQWHMQLYFAEYQYLNILINAIDQLYDRGVEILDLYIG